MIRGIAHVGVAVYDLNEAVATYERVLAGRLIRRLESERQRVTAAFIDVGGSEVELIAPLDSESGVARFLDRRGQGLHHLCFEVDDVAHELKRLTTLGVSVIDQHAREPDVDSPFRTYAWLHPKSCGGLLIELVELRA